MSSDDRSEISALSDISQQAPPLLSALRLRVSLLRFVPHAARSCCSLFYKSKCQAHFLAFWPVPLSHVTLQDPRVQRETRYSIHGITEGGGVIPHTPQRSYFYLQVSNTAVQAAAVYLAPIDAEKRGDGEELWSKSSKKKKQFYWHCLNIFLVTISHLFLKHFF